MSISLHSEAVTLICTADQRHTAQHSRYVDHLSDVLSDPFEVSDRSSSNRGGDNAL